MSPRVTMSRRVPREIVMICGLVRQQEPLSHSDRMKFISLADWTGIIETELLAQTYKSFLFATVRCLVLEVELFENWGACSASCVLASPGDAALIWPTSIWAMDRISFASRHKIP